MMQFGLFIWQNCFSQSIESKVTLKKMAKVFQVTVAMFQNTLVPSMFSNKLTKSTFYHAMGSDDWWHAVYGVSVCLSAYFV